jgi:DNA polymerase-3 subunit beta
VAKASFTLQTLPAEDFPLVQEAANFGPALQHSAKRPSKDLLEPGGLCHGGAGHSLLPERHPVRRRRQATLSLVATDGHRLAFASATLDIDVPKQEVILPRKTVLELQRLLSDAEGDNQPQIAMQFANNQAKFSFGAHGVRHQAGRGQVPRLQPRDSAQNHKQHHYPGPCAPAWPACSAPPS